MSSEDDLQRYKHELDLIFEDMEQRAREHQEKITALTFARELANQGVKIRDLTLLHKRILKLGTLAGMTTFEADTWAKELVQKAIAIRLAKPQ